MVVISPTMSSENSQQPAAPAAHHGETAGKVLIQGLTEEGRKFRPSDWAERMCGTLSTFGGRRIHYSPLLQPVSLNGIKCIVIDPALQEVNPDLFNYVLSFARSNHLKLSGPGID